jgi:integrase
MKHTRQKGTGSITPAGKNSWRIQIYAGKGPDGKYRRYTETIRGLKRDARERLNELLPSLSNGIYVPPGRLTLTEHLHSWLNGYVKTNCSQRTLDGYETIVEHHLIPALGHIQLKQLQAQTIQAYYGRAYEKLSARSVHHHHRVLSEALKYAVRQGCLGRNPCELVDPPSPRKKTMRFLTPEEVETLLSAARGNQYYPVIYTAVSSGLRQAELLGLRWRDVDPDIMLSISVCQVLYKRRGDYIFKEPKTQRSRRYVRMTPKLAAFLREYKQERKALFRNSGKELSLDDLVFANAEGKPLDPSYLSHSFGKLVKHIGLQGVRFHDLRHTFTSLMLLRGVSVKVVSEALGHASAAFTLDTYGHIIPGMDSDAMASLDEILPDGAINTELTRTLSVMASRN